MSALNVRISASDSGDATPRPQDLLMAARGGDVDGLGRLLEAYRHYLRILATTQIDRRLCARVSPSDVVQETLFEAHRDFVSFRGATEHEFIAWLRQILVNNLARTVERHLIAGKRDVRREVSLDGTRTALERSSARLRSLVIDSGHSPSAAAQQREHAVILADVLAEIAEDYREVIVLRNLEGLSFNDVAKRLGRTSGATRMLWLRAIEQLRAKLKTRELI
jgi:RNA polymerase sigma-70 factor (ECF subfamily)